MRAESSSSVPLAPAENSAGVVGALFALLAAFVVAAAVDFEGAAGLGVKAGYGLLALAPWVLWVRSSESQVALAQAEIEGVSVRVPTVAWGWLMLETGALARIPGYLEPFDGFLIGAAFVMAAGAGAMHWRIRPKLGAPGRLGHAAWLAFATLVGLAAIGLGLDPVYEVLSYRFGHVLVSAFLLPQVVQDWFIVRWAQQTGHMSIGREALSSMGMSFILWSLAGHLVITPSILYWSPIPSVVWAGFAAASLLVLFALRAAIGSFSRKTAAMLIAASVIYAVTLAAMAKGNRWYPEKDFRTPTPETSQQ